MEPYKIFIGMSMRITYRFLSTNYEDKEELLDTIREVIYQENSPEVRRFLNTDRVLNLLDDSFEITIPKNLTHEKKYQQ